MAESELAVTPGVGLNLRTDTKTISSTTRHQQVMLLGDVSSPTYTAIGIGLSAATSASHLMFIQGDGSNYTRIHRIAVKTRGTGTAGVLDVRVLRTSTAGSGGSTVNGRPFDAADTDPYGGTIQTLPSSKGTEGNQLLEFDLPSFASTGSVGSAEWTQSIRGKPIIIGTSTANGICIKVQTGIASITVDIEVEFSVTAHL